MKQKLATNQRYLGVHSYIHVHDHSHQKETDSDKAEDEVHFLFHCSLYDDLRAPTLLSKMSFISDEFFWLNDYKKLLFAELWTEKWPMLQSNIICNVICSCLTDVSPL